MDGLTFGLPNVGCFGDESRLCCNVPFKGQKVVATGMMKVVAWNEARVESWTWVFRDQVTLCAL